MLWNITNCICLSIPIVWWLMVGSVGTYIFSLGFSCTCYEIDVLIMPLYLSWRRVFHGGHKATSVWCIELSIFSKKKKMCIIKKKKKIFIYLFSFFICHLFKFMIIFFLALLRFIIIFLYSNISNGFYIKIVLVIFWLLISSLRL